MDELINAIAAATLATPTPTPSDYAAGRATIPADAEPVPWAN